MVAVSDGTVIGLGSAGNAFGVLFGSILGGVVVDATGHDEAAFFTAGAAMGLGLVGFLLLTRGRPQVGSSADSSRPPTADHEL